MLKILYMLFFVVSCSSAYGTELSKIKEVNDYYNSFTYMSDVNLKGKKDHWSSPKEFESDQAGDCEDFAISKFFKLKKMGVNEENLSIFYVKYNGQPHMVLAYYDKNKIYILDNIDKEIKTTENRKDLFPVYSFNTKTIFVGKGFKKDNVKTTKNNIKPFLKIMEIKNL